MAQTQNTVIKIDYEYHLYLAFLSDDRNWAIDCILNGAKNFDFLQNCSDFLFNETEKYKKWTKFKIQIDDELLLKKKEVQRQLDFILIRDLINIVNDYQFL